MIIKVLAATAALAMLAAGSAHAQGYGTPPYGSSAYAYGGGSCGGFTIAGGYAGVTLLGIDFGVAGRARVNGGCGGGASYAPPPPPPAPSPVYGGGGGGAYYGQPTFAPAAYAQPSYGYAPPPSGCQAAPMAYRPY